MRLIDADELKTHKFLTPQVKVIGGRHNGKVKEQIIEAYQQGWNDAIDAIIDNAPTVLHDNYSMGYQDGVRKVLSERPQGEWIPISERLPEKNGNYLCTVDYGEDGIVVMQRVYWDKLGGFEKRYDKNDKVIAWMPLPEAYKEAEE